MSLIRSIAPPVAHRVRDDAEANIPTTDTRSVATQALVHLSGARAALDGHGRNARLPVPQNPMRWKHQTIGRYALSGERPSRHGTI